MKSFFWWYKRHTVSTCNETVEKIIILVHAVWELVNVETCCSGICQKYDAPLPSMISATLQNTLNWNFPLHYYSKVDAQTVIKASYIPCPIIKDKVEQFLTFNLQKQKNTPIQAVMNI